MQALIAAQAIAAEPSLRVICDAHERPVAFEAIDLPASRIRELAELPADDEAFPRFLAVYVADEPAANDQPAMLGTYSIEKGVLRFTPRYPLRPGLKYSVTLRPSGIAETKDVVVVSVTGPEPKAGKPAEITHVYPTASVLPENQLKFYIHFSAPMSRGEAYERVRLLRADGEPIDVPFLELGEELWDASGRRLTLLIDPGRIKQGLKPREDVGPVLEAGQKYTLAIDAAWKAADGRPLARGHRKSFETAAPIAEAIDPAEWVVNAPRAGSKAPVRVRFPRPLDRALLERTLQVVGDDDVPIAGRVEVSREERLWEFYPEPSLPAGRYRLVVDTVLEDLAGNRVGQAFEIEQTDRPATRGQPASVSIPFDVPAAAATGK